jgi:hypothetical protein
MSLENLLNELAGTAELMGKQLSPVALAMMAKDLSAYDYKIISEALKNVRNGTKQFSQGAIVNEIEMLKPDGRIGADEAWAIYPHDEATSAVLTNEIAEAMQIAKPLLDEGDKIGARMAFKEAYNRIVIRNKNEGIAPKWFPSLGHSKEGREEVLKQAVMLGRLSKDHAQSILPPPKNSVLEAVMPQLKMLANNEKLSEEERLKNKARMAEIKSMLIGKQA